MRTLLRSLDRFWFVAAPARRLAVLRIIIGTFSLHYLGSGYFQFPSRVGGSPDMYEPVGLALLLPEPLPASVFQAVVLLTLVVNVAFVLGWRFRTTGPLFGTLLTLVLCYRNSWGMIYHSDNLLVLHVLVLGVSGAAAALSLDSLEQHGLPSHRAQVSRDDTDWRYGWPVRLMCAVTVISYFMAGVAKVTGPLGWSWATAQSLRNQIAVDGLRKEFLGAGAPELVFAFAGWDAIFLAIGVLTLVVELGAPAALLHRRLAALWVPAALTMHWGIFFIMDIEFRYALMGLPFIAFFPLERLLPRADGEAVVLFDGACARCLTSQRWAGSLDWFGEISWVSFRDPDVRAAVPQLSDDQLESEMWVVVSDGRMLPGFFGWRYVLSRFPLTRVLSLLLFVPPIPSLGRRIYRRLASRRRRCELVPQRSVPSGSQAAILLRAQHLRSSTVIPANDVAGVRMQEHGALTYRTKPDVKTTSGS